MKKIVLIADIVSSRKIENRGQIQIRLDNILAGLNKENHNLISPYAITLGDEFQGVYSTSENIFRDAVGILANLYPTKIRFSYGIGKISTELNEKSSLKMDGPAFYMARDGIDKLDKGSSLFSINGMSGTEEKLINQSLAIFSHELVKWKESRLLAFHHILQGRTVKEIARILNLSDKTIYKTINAGMLDIFQNQFKEIEELMNRELL